jgi:NAD(P)-dependent dehydrogenase (short-subunit alcohol dehydrogenase family)
MKSLGECLASTIAQHAPKTLILASRTVSKLEAVAQLVKKETNLSPSIVELDLSSKDSIHRAAAQVTKIVNHIDILINNAAVVSSERRETIDGLELTFGTNHIGHFLWTTLLTPLLLESAESTPGSTRIVNVTSLGYRLSPVRFHDYNFEGKPVPLEEEPPKGLPPHMKPDMSQNRRYQGFCAYGQSKTANILHCVSINERYRMKGLNAFAVHPGCKDEATRKSDDSLLILVTAIWTDLSRNLTPEDLKVIEGTATSWYTLDQGIATILVAALDPKLANAKTDVFLSDCKLEDVADTAKDPEIAERLWKLSETLARSNAKI